VPTFDHNAAEHYTHFSRRRSCTRRTSGWLINGGPRGRAQANPDDVNVLDLDRALSTTPRDDA